MSKSYVIDYTCQNCGHRRTIRRLAQTPKTQKYYCDGCRKMTKPNQPPKTKEQSK